MVAEASGSTPLRARAWNAILAIHEESVRTVEWGDEVRSNHNKFGWHDLASRTVQCDDLGTFRLDEITRALLPPEGQNQVPRQMENSIQVFASDGITIGRAGESDWFTVRPFNPDRLMMTSTPGLWNALGRSLCPLHFETRSERLSACADLDVLKEDSRHVTLQGNGPMWSSRYGHIIEIDAQSGDVLRHRTTTPMWKTVVTDWQMRDWHEIDGARVPRFMVYQMWEPDLTPEQRSAVQRERQTSGIPPEAQWPEHPRYADWEAVRDRVLGPEIPIRLAGPRQESRIAVQRVNRPIVIHRPERPEGARFMSAFLEAPIDHPHPEGRDTDSSVPAPAKTDTPPVKDMPKRSNP